MFESQHDIMIQRGIDEAFSCQDMLARAPATPSIFARLWALMVTAVRTKMRPAPATPPTVSLEPRDAPQAMPVRPRVIGNSDRVLLASRVGLRPQPSIARRTACGIARA